MTVLVAKLKKPKRLRDSVPANGLFPLSVFCDLISSANHHIAWLFFIYFWHTFLQHSVEI